MKCLDETPGQVANRMRELAAGVTNPADADAIKRYADWLERHPDADDLRDSAKAAREGASLLRGVPV